VGYRLDGERRGAWRAGELIMLGLGLGVSRSAVFRGGAATLLAAPSGFTMTLPADFFVQGLTFSTDYDIADDMPDTTGWREEWAAPDGSTTNTSSTTGSRVTLRKAIDNAIAAAVPTVIHVKDDIYRGAFAWDGRNPGIELVFLRETGGVMNGRSVSLKAASTTAPSYAKTGGQTNVYEMTVAAPTQVVDLLHRDAHNGYRFFTLVASIAAVDGAQNSYFHDGTKLYVHALNAGDTAVRAADAYVQPLAGGSAEAAWTPTGNNRTLYIEHMDILGASIGLNASVAAAAGITGCKLLLNSVTFQGSNGNGLQVGMQGSVRDVSCSAIRNVGDGFSYSGEGGSGQAAAASPDVLSVAPYARSNGSSAASNDNGWTTHGLTRAILLNPDIDDSYDRAIHCVAGTQTWILGGAPGDVVAASGAAATVDSNTNTAAIAAGGSGAGTATIWADGVTISTNADDDLQELSGGVIKVTARTSYNAGNVTGTIETYTP
jgi:hypothetical protein